MLCLFVLRTLQKVNLEDSAATVSKLLEEIVSQGDCGCYGCQVIYQGSGKEMFVLAGSGERWNLNDSIHFVDAWKSANLTLDLWQIFSVMVPDICSVNENGNCSDNLQNGVCELRCWRSHSLLWCSLGFQRIYSNLPPNWNVHPPLKSVWSCSISKPSLCSCSLCRTSSKACFCLSIFEVDEDTVCIIFRTSSREYSNFRTWRRFGDWNVHCHGHDGLKRKSGQVWHSFKSFKPANFQKQEEKHWGDQFELAKDYSSASSAFSAFPFWL